MRLNLIFFALIIVSNARQVPPQQHGRKNGRVNKRYRHHNMWTADSDCSKSVSSTTTLPQCTSTTETTTSDPCVKCRNTIISITDTWAGQCGPRGIAIECNCLCADVFCSENEIIDRSTCTPYGNIQDCRCISTSTTTSTTATPKVYKLDRYAGCEGCMNDELNVGDTRASYCFPDTSGEECACLCGDLFCQDGQIIDRTTCVSGGKFQDCKCIDPTSTTTSPSPTPGFT